MPKGEKSYLHSPSRIERGKRKERESNEDERWGDNDDDNDDYKNGNHRRSNRNQDMRSRSRSRSRSRDKRELSAEDYNKDILDIKVVCDCMLTSCLSFPTIIFISFALK